jgi:hypothetical protein
MKKFRFSPLCAVFFIVASLTSCSKEDAPAPVDNGASTGDYWPMAIDNEWTYESNGTPIDPIKITNTDDFDGTTYYKLSTKNEYDAQVWITKKGATYFQKTGDINFTSSGISGTIPAFEVPILKDDLVANDTWSGNIATNISYTYGPSSYNSAATITYTGTVLEKDITVTLHDVNYTDCIKVQIVKEISTGGSSPLISTTTTTWYSKGIGPVKETTDVVNNVSGTPQSSTFEQNLISSTLKK